EDNFHKSDIEDYYVRRFKNDLTDDTVKENFMERKVISLHASLFPEENLFLEKQQNLKFSALTSLESNDKKDRKRDLLFSINLFKAYMSSPEAALKSVNNRIKKIEERGTESESTEISLAVLNDLREDLEYIINKERDAKYKKFKEELVRLKWNGRKKDFRIVVFAERIETLVSLREKLQRDFNIK